MKNKITTNLFLKVLSVIMAFLFWLVIINMIDPTVAKTFRDIPVEILNENVITSANQVFEVESGDTVNVTVKGKRSFVETLSPRDFTAVADLSEHQCTAEKAVQFQCRAGLGLCRSEGSAGAAGDEEIPGGGDASGRTERELCARQYRGTAQYRRGILR